MIRSEAQLRQVIEQMGRLYEALAAMRARVQPENPELFALMAEGPIEELARLQREVDEFVGVAALREAEADVWVRIHGPAMEWERAPTSILTSLMDKFRKGVQSVAEWIDRGSLTTRPTSELLAACDLRLVGLLPGSVQVGLRLPDEEAAPKHAVAEEALQEYLTLAVWAASGNDEALERRIPDRQQRRVLLGALKPILPPKRGAIDFVELWGRRMPGGRPARLTREVHARLDREIKRLSREELETWIGVIREIDLDRATFVVRDEMTGRQIQCGFPDYLYDVVKEGLDRLVLVRGSVQRWGSRREAASLQVSQLEILDEERQGQPG